MYESWTIYCPNASVAFTYLRLYEIFKPVKYLFLLTICKELEFLNIKKSTKGIVNLRPFIYKAIPMRHLDIMFSTESKTM
jgi:hypothetical protein